MEVVAASPTPDDGVTTAQRATDPAPQSSRTLRLVLAGVLILGLVCSLAWLGLEIVSRVSADDSVQSDREAVMLRSQEYVLAAATVGPKDLDEDGALTTYAQRVKPLISTARKPVFEEGLASLADQVTVSGYTTITKVNRVGVESLDEDTATAIVDLEQALSTKDEDLGSLGGQWRVKLVRVDGTWLVDSVTDILGGAK